MGKLWRSVCFFCSTSHAARHSSKKTAPPRREKKRCEPGSVGGLGKTKSMKLILPLTDAQEQTRGVKRPMRRIPPLLLICAACSQGLPVQGLAPAEKTGGPQVLFDLTPTPLPEVPFPHDGAPR